MAAGLLKKMRGPGTQYRTDRGPSPRLAELCQVDEELLESRGFHPNIESFNGPKAKDPAGGHAGDLRPWNVDRREEVCVIDAERSQHQAPAYGKGEQIAPYDQGKKPIEPWVIRPEVGEDSEEAEGDDERRGRKNE
jgi:hypothetical protein